MCMRVLYGAFSLSFQSMGFPIEASKAALAEHHTVAAAVDAMVNRTGNKNSTSYHH